jgi:pimeloyl-ACP methyl ester carboxylesterase
MTTTFGLIHGAWHGAWCWERLAAELERRGHRAVAVDLPCDDPAVTTMDNARQVLEALGGTAADVAADVVVVGHSLGGIVAPVVAQLRPVRRVVLLAALVPRPGRSLRDVMASEPECTTEEFDKAPRHIGDHGAVTWDPEVAARLFYRSCDPDTARWAAARLRPQVWTTSQEISPLERWPDCELASIVCADDEVLAPDWSRRIAREVLRIDPVELPGGHSPMLSHPAELADALTT